MNKQKLIEKYEEKHETIFGFPVIQLNQILEDLKKLDEPQKVVVPRYIGEWLRESKHTFEIPLRRAMKEKTINSFAGKPEKIIEWLSYADNQEIFARAWLDGYAKEKQRFLVSLEGFPEGFNFLNFNETTNAWSLSDSAEAGPYRTYHTDDELRQAGFEWLFDSKGVIIEGIADE